MEPRAITVADVTSMNGEPRIADGMLSVALGFQSPKELRHVIRRNAAELCDHGAVSLQIEAKARGERGRPSQAYFLNEAQALLVCVFARTPAAAVVRKQIGGVFMAYRQGNLPPATPPRVDRWEAMANRHRQIDEAVAFNARRCSTEYVTALATLPPEWLGMGKCNRKPSWWSDLEVRTLVVALYRQGTIDGMRALILREVGAERVPSRSSIARYWRQMDQMIEADR